METAGLVAPHLMPAEVTNVLRKLVTSGSLSAGTTRAPGPTCEFVTPGDG